MSELLKRGAKAYKIFLQNKLVASFLMLISGIMMAISGLTGNGNDTKTLPTTIVVIGAVLSLWAFYRIGFTRAKVLLDKDARQKKIDKRNMIMMIFEAALYLFIVGIGVFLLINEKFTNTALNVMAGGFSILNGVFGVIYLIKNRKNIETVWKFKLVLTILEFGLGIYFIFAAKTIGMTAFILLGALTTVAGILEVILALSFKEIVNTAKDGRDIVRTLKTGKKDDDEDEEELLGLEDGEE